MLQNHFTSRVKRPQSREASVVLYIIMYVGCLWFSMQVVQNTNLHHLEIFIDGGLGVNDIIDASCKLLNFVT